MTDTTVHTVVADQSQIGKSAHEEKVTIEYENSSHVRIWSLYAGFGLIIFIIALLSVFGLMRNKQVNTVLDEVVTTRTARMDIALQMRIESQSRAYHLYAIANSTDAFEIDDLTLDITSRGEQFLKLREKFINLDLDSKEKQLIEEHRELAKTVIPLQRKVIELANQEQLAEARELLVAKALPLQEEALQIFNKIIGYEHVQSEDLLGKARKASQVTQVQMAILSAIGIFVSVIITITVSRRLLKTFRDLRHAKEGLEIRVEERTRELQIINERLEQLANFDDLTGLPNRASFGASLNICIAQAKPKKQRIALLFIDLDGFKSVNDSHGHDYGDELLRQVADRLSETLRDADIISRIGGDEFTVILPGIKRTEDVGIVAEKIITALKTPFKLKDVACTIGCSIGIAIYPDHASDDIQLVKLSDIMMYEVKKAGKNHYKFCSPDDTKKILSTT